MTNEITFYYTDRRVVDSSVLNEVVYDAENEDAVLRFNNGTEYWYDDVSPAKYETLVNAPSVGAVYNRDWYGQHESEAVRVRSFVPHGTVGNSSGPQLHFGAKNNTPAPTTNTDGQFSLSDLLGQVSEELAEKQEAYAGDVEELLDSDAAGRRDFDRGFRTFEVVVRVSAESVQDALDVVYDGAVEGSEVLSVQPV